MAKTVRTFTKGKMNKDVDERLLADGEYTSALNARINSTEGGEVGSLENSKGNQRKVVLKYIDQSTTLSSSTTTIGAFADDTNEKIYWFVHDPAFTVGGTGKLDMIVSYDAKNNRVTYHVISVQDKDLSSNTTLNFDPEYLITGVDLIDDLLFFTDGLNPPRVIDITKTYGVPNGSNVDTITAEELLVIKKPPIFAPEVELINTDGDETYLEDRFICFAYRYRYEDGGYSATSPFTQPAFEPNTFDFSTESFLNEGMKNKFNGAIITYDTGNTLVTGIDLLFKEADSNVIRVIKKIDKAASGVPSNTTDSFTFSASKIYTILPDSEILRLYDNVPLTAKAQTIMGNRLIYGNYTEGYDLKSADGADVQLDYFTNIKREDVGRFVYDSDIIQGPTDYEVDGSVVVDDSVLVFDMSDAPLEAGDTINIDFTFKRSKISNAAGGGSSVQTTPNTDVSFVFTLPRSYINVHDLVYSSEFIEAFGTSGASPFGEIANYQSVANSCDGNTFTDIFNCAVPVSLSGYTKTQSFNKGTNPVSYIKPELTSSLAGGIIFDTNSKFIKFSLLTMEFDNGANSFFEYYQITSATVTYEKSSSSLSLHSNRNYEVGMVYMDSFGRASTTLVSDNNSVYIPCRNSSFKNSIKVTIPTSQKPPEWADYYKFVIKPDKAGYETIYSSIYFTDPEDVKYSYFLLDGENSSKIEDGDELIVKADINGVRTSCVKTVVLEKKAQEKDFLDGFPEGFEVPAGVYMKLNTENFTVSSENLNFSFGKQSTSTKDGTTMTYRSSFPVLAYKLWRTSGTSVSLTQGTRVSFNIEFERKGAGDGNGNCERRKYTFDKTFVIPNNYDNIKEWWYDQNIAQYIDEGIQEVGGGDDDFEEIKNVFDETDYTAITSNAIRVGGNEQIGDIVQDSSSSGDFLGTNPVQVGDYVLNQLTGEVAKVTNVTSNVLSLDTAIMVNIGALYAVYREASAFELMPYDEFTNYWAFVEDSDGLYLVLTGTEKCGGTDGRKSSISANIQVFTASEIIFETEPQDASPDIFFESAKVYEISGNNHLGDLSVGDTSQNIGSGIAAEITTDFANCYAFGNGAESYKIEDSITGASFLLGNRVTAVAAQDYKRAHRFADITYSGIYNDESNVNKLNEFNLGLLNYKDLEDSFGEVQILDGRLTDILVLQSDKISYVLAGKNLLSDSVGGGSIASVPEVLGTQIARNEENGISFNPESYVHHGNSRFFTDAKRGVVLRLLGSSSSSDRLDVISEFGMRTWFRDLFIDSFDTQKLGAFDSYMDEYVLASNDRVVDSTPEVLTCGGYRNFFVPANSQVTFVIDYPNKVGTSTIQYFPQNDPAINFEVSAEYNSVTSSSGSTTTSGSFTVAKDKIDVNTAEITIDNNSVDTELEIVLGLGCPADVNLTVVQVVVSTDNNDQKTTYAQYKYTDGTYNGPSQTKQVKFSDGTMPVISSYNSKVGPQGDGAFPTNGSTVTITSYKEPFATFTFDTSKHRLLYLRSNVLYDNNQSDVLSLLAAATNVTPLTVVSEANNIVSGEFTMPSSSDQYLYLIWDLRTIESVELTYDASTASTACCS